jgi:hypothetical protein
MKFFIKAIKSWFSSHNQEIPSQTTSTESFASLNLDHCDIEAINKIRPYTLTSTNRIVALLDSLHYICKNNIEGSIVECGVWQGGSMMLSALVLKRLGQVDRDIFLYDTFDGMSKPTEDDIDCEGRSALELLRSESQRETYLCRSSFEDVYKNMISTGYPANKIHLIKGKVEETVVYEHGRKIALLRLDTDWYESTKHELLTLYPSLTKGGIMIIDDYGHWQGAKKAVDEYFSGTSWKPFLSRIDYTGRVLVKTTE